MRAVPKKKGASSLEICICNRPISASVATVAMRELEYNLQLFQQEMTAKVKAQRNRLESRPELFLSRYFNILQSKEARERYLKKLQLVDPYEISLTFWNLGLP